jgi:subtilisin family serine protease
MSTRLIPLYRAGLARAVAAALCLLAAALPARAVTDAVDGEVLLQLASGDALQPLLVKHRLVLIARFGQRPIFRVAVAPGSDADVLAETLSLEPGVLRAERNTIQRSPEARRNLVWAIGTPSAYTAQWAPQALRLQAAHAVSRGAGIRVAVLDTGVDAAHPALAGRLLPGRDFVDGDLDAAEAGTRADAGFGHGTHVAGLVALAAPEARIVPLRVLDASGAGNAWVIGEALLHAVDPDGNPDTADGAQVINLSLGTPSRTRILDTVAELAACALPDPADPAAVAFADAGYNADKARCAAGGGAVILAAAGNDGSRTLREYPAAESVYGMLAVTASAASRRLADFANRGSWVDVAAPGDGITSSVPGGGFGTWSGTSMAAPLAAGVAALVRAARPGLAPRAVVRRMARSATALCGTSIMQIDAVRALAGTESDGGDCN